MKEHGIIMSAPMVLALLAGRKTVTRRTSDRWAKVSPGDRLWVRETWRAPAACDGDSPTKAGAGAVQAGYPRPFLPVRYEADGDWNHAIDADNLASDWGGWSKRARPAIHMPRWASRIVLEVVSVDREQGVEGVSATRRGDVLPSVTDAEAIAEGIYAIGTEWTWSTTADRWRSPREAYLALFREINGDAMPDHLWRIEFRRVA